MSDGMIEFGGMWIRASLIESVRGYALKVTGEASHIEWGVKVMLVTGRLWTHVVVTTPHLASPAEKDEARADRDLYISEFLQRMRAVS